MRLNDHLLANFMVWIPTIFDFTAKNDSKGYASALFWNAPLMGVCWVASAYACEAILKRAPRLPSWFLNPLLFVTFMGVMFPLQAIIFVAQFYACGDACVVV